MGDRLPYAAGALECRSRIPSPRFRRAWHAAVGRSAKSLRLASYPERAPLALVPTPRPPARATKLPRKLSLQRGAARTSKAGADCVLHVRSENGSVMLQGRSAFSVPAKLGFWFLATRLCRHSMRRGDRRGPPGVWDTKAFTGEVIVASGGLAALAAGHTGWKSRIEQTGVGRIGESIAL